MKKREVKKLSLEKITIAKLQNMVAIKGGSEIPIGNDQTDTDVLNPPPTAG